MKDYMIAIGVSVLILIGLISIVIRDMVVAKQKFHVKPKLFIGYDKESESNWNKKFGYGHQLLQLPNLKSLYEAFDPSILTLDEAEAETVIKLDYSWGTGKTYGQSGSFYGNIAGISLHCVITVSSREDQKVIMCQTIGGKPPPDTITYRPGYAPSEYYGEMPSVESIIYFLKKLRVETLDDIAVSPKVETLIESQKKSSQSDFKGQELNPSSPPTPTTFQTCPACRQLVSITEYSCPNCGNVFWNPLRGLGCGVVMVFALIALVSNFAFASGSSLWIVVAIVFDFLFGFTGIMMTLTLFKALLKIYRPNLTPKLDKETVPSTLDKELFDACEKGDSEKVKALIENHANVNVVSGDYSCLLTAVVNGNYEIVKSLVAAGANVNWKNRLDDTALKIAAMQNHQEIVDFLKSAGAISTGAEKTQQDNINEVLLAENQELLNGDLWVNISLTGADAMQSVRLHNLKGGKKLCFSVVAAYDQSGKTELIVQDTSSKSYSLNDITEPVILYMSKDTLKFLKQNVSIWDRVKNRNSL